MGVTAQYTIFAVGLKIMIGTLISVLLHRLERKFEIPLYLLYTTYALGNSHQLAR